MYLKYSNIWRPWVIYFIDKVKLYRVNSISLCVKCTYVSLCELLKIFFWLRYIYLELFDLKRLTWSFDVKTEWMSNVDETFLMVLIECAAADGLEQQLREAFNRQVISELSIPTDKILPDLWSCVVWHVRWGEQDWSFLCLQSDLLCCDIIKTQTHSHMLFLLRQPRCVPLTHLWLCLMIWSFPVFYLLALRSQSQSFAYSWFLLQKLKFSMSYYKMWLYCSVWFCRRIVVCAYFLNKHSCFKIAWERYF